MEMKEGQFGKVGEHMVGFELSKRGWIVFFPPYDERIDIIALKFVCEKCNALWDTTHLFTCTNTKCSLSNSEIVKSRIVKNKICSKCGETISRQTASSQLQKCPICKNGLLEEIALCYKCGSKIDVKKNKCTATGCDSTKYKIMFRTIQVKSTHLVDNGKNLGFNFKFQDLLEDERHFFVIYNRDIIENKERHFYWILNVEDFKSIKNVETIAFKIYQNDRCHFPPDKLKGFFYDEEAVYKMQGKISKAETNNDIEAIKQMKYKLLEIDRFRILDKITTND